MEEENTSGQPLNTTTTDDDDDNNNHEQNDLQVPIGDDAADRSWNDAAEFELYDLLGGDEGHTNTNETNDDEDHHSDADSGRQSKRTKRFNVEQLAVLEAKFKACPHPDTDERQELGMRIGLEERQLKDCGDENKDMFQENATLWAENKKLRRQLLQPSCIRCRGSIALPTQAAPEKMRLLIRNSRLRDEILRANAYLNKLIVCEAEQPPPSAQAALVSHAERAMKEFVMLATAGEPMWLSTDGGDGGDGSGDGGGEAQALNHEAYIVQTFPGLLGLCPRGFVEEATRDMDMIKGTAMDLVTMLTDVSHWSEMFPGIVASVSSSHVISTGTLWLNLIPSVDSSLQMNVDLWVQSPRLLTRRIRFLRFSKKMASGKWAVVDVSVDGIHGAEHTGCRLLPSGCLLQDMEGSGYCKVSRPILLHHIYTCFVVTWIVHAEYDEATVPPLFRPLFQSGQALGASRWLRSLLRQCEYMAVLRSSHVESSSSSSSSLDISTLGRRGVLELGRRMTASFYATVSGPIIVPSSNMVDEWRVSTSTGAERIEASVRMAAWNCGDIVPGEPAVTVVSATTTVWLPDVPPPRVFEYLCDLQRRGEWDVHVNGGAVQGLGSVATSTHPNGNAVSVLRPTTTSADKDGRKSNSMLILQETSIDASCSLVVYSFIEESLMRGVMDGGDNSAIFLLPSGFAIHPDGRGKARHDAANTSSGTPTSSSSNNSGGSLLTVAYQAMSSCPSGDFARQAFDAAGQRICRAMKMIKAAVGASDIVPA
ncbi:hypothetical protein U9M48_032104 [Paspalum notatum var. saurae]|uniref:START domain-containing protein n=1 Tax=Paspalum notatum var. saurae TaxID=547442 RepID=A0AAQ3X443_PASNO